jgi:DNA-binding HxlR family transcriptional regulator
MEKQDFIVRKGGIDIIFMLSNGLKSFDEFKPLKLSPNTILLRLREAQSLGIIEQKLLGGMKGRPKIKYALTGRGGKVLEASKDIKNRYLELNEEVNRLKMEIRKKESEIQTLLFSLQKSYSSNMI